IAHIPEILYHWRSIAGSTAMNMEQKAYANDAQKRAIESHLKRVGARAAVESVHGLHWKINYALPTEPTVSIIIPTKDRIDLLRSCIDSILEKTAYRNYQIIVVDNASEEPSSQRYFEEISRKSNIRILRDNSTFNFSAINNRAIANA